MVDKISCEKCKYYDDGFDDINFYCGPNCLKEDNDGFDKNKDGDCVKYEYIGFMGKLKKILF